MRKKEQKGGTDARGRGEGGGRAEERRAEPWPQRWQPRALAWVTAPPGSASPSGKDGQRCTCCRLASRFRNNVQQLLTLHVTVYTRTMDALFVLLLAATAFSVVFHKKRQEGEQDGGQEACPKAPWEGGGTGRPRPSLPPPAPTGSRLAAAPHFQTAS